MVHSVPQSCKNIWVLLSGSSLLKSKEFIGLLLEQNAAQIVNGVLYHKKFDKSVNIQELWKKYEIDNIPVDFIEKLSKLINLDPLHCHDLFLAFLLYEFKGTPKSVQNLFTNEKNLQNLLLQLHEFYLSERLFSLFCLKQILANYHQTSAHPYQTLFNGFYHAANKDESILIKLIDQFNECINAKIPNRNENGPYLSENLINNWVKNNIMESLKILECILIYLKHSESDGKFTKQLITTFQNNTFFTRYQYFKQVATLSDSIRYENLVKLISFTQSLIIIESLKLNRFKKALDDNTNDHYLMVNKQLKNEINDIIQSKCNSLEVYSPVLLSWMLIKSLDQEEREENQKQIEYLGLTALNLNAFEYINNCLHSAEFENLSDSAFSSIAKNVVGTLLSNFFLQFDIDIIKDKLNLLFTICSKLFDDDDLIESMFNKLENCGLYSIYLKSFSTFNLDLVPFLQLTHSISKTNQNIKFLDVLTNLSSYTEYFNFNTPLISTTEEKGIYHLNADRRIFQDNVLFTSTLVIPKGSLGILRERSEKNGNLIEWQNVQLDALKILVYLYKDRIDKICSSGHYNNLVNEISILNNIFANLIKSKPDYQLLQNIAESMYVLKLFRRYSNVDRIFIASAFNLFSTLVELNPKLESIWEQISESGFFPYLTGLSNEQKLAGHEINASKIGELIVSEECMKGEYDLCCAYLNLLSTSFPTQINSIACPLLVHVVSEIFPCFQQWHYKNVNDYKKIAFKCLQLFQIVLTLPNNKELVNICRFGLLSGPAGETLLNIIVKGETFVRQIIEQTGNTNVLFKDELIIMVRSSLSVLNRLLVLQEKDKNETFKTSTVEQALFSIQSSKPNMILVLTHYVFQRYDTRLATLAVTLLKTLSKHFPMSLLACLGSEAESVRDHFLYRLEEVTEDIRLKIALLDFLSCCIRYQPGLIEMFLNSDSHNHKDDSKKSTDETNKKDDDKLKPDQHNCLKTVIEILEEKLNEKYFCPSELHSAAIKFIFTFWLQPHLLAIDSLKQTENLWTLISFPIYQENNEVDDRLFGYIFKILGREIFYIKTLEKQFDPKLIDIFKKISEGDYLVKLSNHIVRCCSAAITDTNTIFYLLKGWRDFFISYAKFEPFKLDDSKKKIILSNILKSIVDQLKVDDSQVNHDLLMTLCEICVTLLNKWDNKIMNDMIEWREITATILYIVNERKTNLTLGFIINIETILCLSLKAFESQDLSLREPLKDWYSSWCSIFKFVYQILEKNINKISETELKLTCGTLGFFHNLFNATKELNTAWLYVLRNNLILESMVSLLCYLIENKINMQLIDTIQNTFILLSTVPSAAHLLQITRIVDKISYSLLSVNKDDEFVQIFELTLQLATSLLMTIKHHYVEPAINLISLHLDKVVTCLRLVRECPFYERIQEAIKIMSLLCSLTPYKQIWIPLNKKSFDTLLVEIHKTTHSLIAFLIRPNLLQYLIKHRNSPINANILRSTENKKQSENVTRVISFDLDLSNQLDTGVHKMMFILLLQHLTFLNHVNLNLIEVQLMGKKDECKVIDISFSAPNIDPEKKIGFGSLLYCVSLVVRLLNKFEKPQSDTCLEARQIETFTNKKQLILILEASLSLLISQASLAQQCEDLSERDKLSIRRDLKTELTSMLLPKSRHSKRQTPNVSFNSSLIHKTTENSLINEPYIKFLMDSMEELFKP